MKPKQFFFVVLGGLVLLLGAGGAGCYYGFGQIGARSHELATKLAEKDVADQQITSLTTLQHEYNRDILPIMPLIDEALPRSKKQTEILAQIERIAGEAGLSLNAVSMPTPTGLPSEISQTTKAEGVLALPIIFKISGSYQQLQAMTIHLETLNRYTNITTLTIDRSATDNVPSYGYSLNAYIKP